MWNLILRAIRVRRILLPYEIKIFLPKDWEEWLSLAAAADADVAADFELKDVADVAEVEDLRVCDDADDAADADEE